MAKGKIGLLIGDAPWPRLAHTFSALANKYDLTVYLVQKDNILAQIPMPAKAHLFREEDRAPGFLRDAEKQMAQEDLLICVNIGSLSSLQACRTANEHHIPLICYLGDFDLSRYQKYPNLNSIMNLILNSASAFLVPVPEIALSLSPAGISENKIHVLSPKIVNSRFRISQEKRNKFRNYIGMGDSEVIILYHGPLEHDYQPQQLLQAFKLQASLSKLLFPKLKIIFAGSGEGIKELQYLAYNLGIGQSTYFLSQDTEPFVEDLFAASDLMICTRSQNEDSLPVFPYHLYEAMACGVIPLVPEGSIFESIVPDKKFTWNGQSYDSIAFGIKRLIGKPEFSSAHQRAISEHLYCLERNQKEMIRLETLVESLLSYKRQESASHSSSNNIPWDFLSENSGHDKHAAKVIEIVDACDFETLTPDEKSLCHLYKAEALKSLFCYDDAFWEFERSVQWNSSQVQAFSGMGFISWYSHNHEEALGFFKQGLVLSPQDQSCMLGIGLVYKRLSMIEDALFWLEKSISMGEHSKFALKALIQTCNESQDQKQSIAVLERILESVGDQTILMNGLGNLYLKAGYTEIAHQIFEKYLDADETYSDKECA